MRHVFLKSLFLILFSACGTEQSAKDPVVLIADTETVEPRGDEATKEKVATSATEDIEPICGTDVSDDELSYLTECRFEGKLYNDGDLPAVVESSPLMHLEQWSVGNETQMQMSWYTDEIYETVSCSIVNERYEVTTYTVTEDPEASNYAADLSSFDESCQFVHMSGAFDGVDRSEEVEFFDRIYDEPISATYYTP